MEIVKLISWHRLDSICLNRIDATRVGVELWCMKSKVNNFLSLDMVNEYLKALHFTTSSKQRLASTLR